LGNESAAPSTSHNAQVSGRFPVGSPRDAWGHSLQHEYAGYDAAKADEY
jgi:hypothetical protein